MRSFFDGGVSSACTDKIKNRVGSAYVIQIAGKFEEDRHKMKWKTITEVAKILPNNARCDTSRMHSCCGRSQSNLQLGSLWKHLL